MSKPANMSDSPTAWRRGGSRTRRGWRMARCTIACRRGSLSCNGRGGDGHDGRSDRQLAASPCSPAGGACASKRYYCARKARSGLVFCLPDAVYIKFCRDVGSWMELHECCCIRSAKLCKNSEHSSRKGFPAFVFDNLEIIWYSNRVVCRGVVDSPHRRQPCRGPGRNALIRPRTLTFSTSSNRVASRSEAV